VEVGLSSNFDKACGHQEVANMLEQYQTADSNDIMHHPERLHEFTLALQDRLRNGESISTLKDTCSEFNSKFSLRAGEKFERKSEPGEAVVAGYKSLQVGLNPKWSIDRKTLNEELVKLQTEVFNQLGVVFPEPAIVDKANLELNEIQIEADGKELMRVVAFGPDTLAVMASVEELRGRYPDAKPLVNPFGDEPATVLPRTDGLQEELNGAGYTTYDAISWFVGLLRLNVKNNPDLFLTSELLEYYLELLDTDFSSLVAVTRHYFSNEARVELLRRRLRGYLSIKYMPEVLESFLSNPTMETAGIH
jgi:type III secretory pathway component EscV